MARPFFFGPQFPPSYGMPSTSFTSYGSVRPPVLHRPHPSHLPPPISSIDNDGQDGAVQVPAYRPRSNSPPPAYSPVLADEDQHKSFLYSDLESRYPRPREEEEESKEGCGKMSNMVITILIVLNVFVWSAVFYGVICDDETSRLWGEVTQGDRVVFDV